MNIRDRITPFDDSAWVARIEDLRCYLGERRAVIGQAVDPVPLPGEESSEAIQPTRKQRKAVYLRETAASPEMVVPGQISGHYRMPLWAAMGDAREDKAA